MGGEAHMAALNQEADIPATSFHVAEVPILLQKSAIITAKRLTAIF
jgi:hypothetical protein